MRINGVTGQTEHSRPLSAAAPVQPFKINIRVDMFMGLGVVAGYSACRTECGGWCCSCAGRHAAASRLVRGVLVLSAVWLLTVLMLLGFLFVVCLVGQAQVAAVPAFHACHRLAMGWHGHLAHISNQLDVMHHRVIPRVWCL